MFLRGLAPPLMKGFFINQGLKSKRLFKTNPSNSVQHEYLKTKSINKTNIF